MTALSRTGWHFLPLSLALHAAIAVALTRGAAPLPEAPPSPPEPKVTLAGETFEVPSVLPAAAEEASPAEPSPGEAPAPKPQKPRPSRVVVKGGDPRGGADAGTEPAVRFGAAGVAYATDVAATFTHAFPQAASADAHWASAHLGATGGAVVTIEIDGEGHLVRSDISGAAHAGLRAGIERTIALIQGRTFTASGPVTRLSVDAIISKDEVHDGLHGEVFAVGGGALTNGTGTAFFSLAVGRRIDVIVRVMR